MGRKSMKIQGRQNADKSVVVYVSGVQLYPDYSQKINNLSPTGFQWGYGGAGPAQLAFALLLLFTDEISAAELFKEFNKEFIVPLQKDQDFDIEIDIQSWIKDHGGKLNKLNFKAPGEKYVGKRVLP